MRVGQNHLGIRATEGRMRTNALRCTGERVAVPTKRTSSVAYPGATERLAGIRAEMAVEDASGEQVGQVIFVQVGVATGGGGRAELGGTPRTEPVGGPDGAVAPGGAHQDRRHAVFPPRLPLLRHD